MNRPDYQPRDMFAERENWRSVRPRNWTIHPIALILAAFILGGILFDALK